MRQFAAGGFRLWNLSREAKLVYTFFALFSLAGIGSSVLLYEDLVGGGTAGIRAYYAGEAPPASATTTAGGPEIALPDERPGAAAPPLVVQASRRKLLEVTHFHLFTVPVFLLIVTHLFMLTGLGPRTKSAGIVGGWLAAAAHLAAPWVVRWGGGGWAWLHAASGAAFGITGVALTVYPVWAMWMGRSEARPTS